MECTRQSTRKRGTNKMGHCVCVCVCVYVTFAQFSVQDKPFFQFIIRKLVKFWEKWMVTVSVTSSTPDSGLVSWRILWSLVFSGTRTLRKEGGTWYHMVVAQCLFLYELKCPFSEFHCHRQLDFCARTVLRQHGKHHHFTSLYISFGSFANRT